MPLTSDLLFNIIFYILDQESFHNTNCLFASKCNHSQSAQLNSNGKQESNTNKKNV